MVWIVIVLVLILALGPILWLLPSKASRRQAALRSAARRAGLVVEIAVVPKLDAAPAERVSAGGVVREAKVDCVAYRLPLPRQLAHAPRWMFVRSDRENRFLEGWTTLRPPVGVPVERSAYWREIQAIVDALPGGCVAVEAAAQVVGWYGRERIGEADPDDVVGAIGEGLSRLADVHLRIEQATSTGEC